MAFKKLDLVKEKFGKLTVISYNGIVYCTNNKPQRTWNCICECGKTTIVKSCNLTGGRVKSCGCIRKNRASQLTRKYDPKISSARKVWQDYKSRDAECINFDIFYKLSQMNCFYCGIDPCRKFNAANYKSSKLAHKNGIYIYNGIDRIDSSKSYTIDNCVPCCKICNVAKNDRSLEEFRLYIKSLKHSNSCKLIIKDIVLEKDKNILNSIKSVYYDYNDNNTLTIENFYSISQMDCFYCCCTKLNKRNDFYYNGLDRVDSSKNHEIGNVVPCCKYCNFAKSNMKFEEFQSWIKRIGEFNK